MTPFPDRPQRYAFATPTPVGEAHFTYQLSADAIDFESDALWDGGRVSVPWSSIHEAATVALDMPVGPGAPDLGRYVPRKLEWLVASRLDAAGKPLMGPLPPAPDRDALLAVVRARLGARFVGEAIPFVDAQRRFGLPRGGGNLGAAGTVIGVLILLLLLLLLLIVLLSPVVLYPALLVFGGWLLRSGLSGFRDALSVANTPTGRVGSAAIGFVGLAGIARIAHPSPAGATGRPCAWWDLSVEVRSTDRDGAGNWYQIAARHGGSTDTLEIEDQAGRVVVWLKDADLLLAESRWEAGKDDLPPDGVALLDELGFPWRSREMRVRETRLENGAAVYVLGTLDQRRTIPGPGESGALANILSQFRTGEWRSTLVRMLPRWLGKLVAVTFTFLSIVLGVGRGGERPKDDRVSAPPDLPAHAVLVWKGLAGRPFIVSNRREVDALSQLRTRSLYTCAAGIGVVCFVVYEMLALL